MGAGRACLALRMCSVAGLAMGVRHNIVSEALGRVCGISNPIVPIGSEVWNMVAQPRQLFDICVRLHCQLRCRTADV
jgi:hypothetical protein